MGLVGLRPGGWKKWGFRDSVVFDIPAFWLPGSKPQAAIVKLY